MAILQGKEKSFVPIFIQITFLHPPPNAPYALQSSGNT
jgi:hypothetical protein